MLFRSAVALDVSSYRGGFFRCDDFKHRRRLRVFIGVFSVFSSRQKTIFVDRSQKIDGAQAKIFPQIIPFTSDILLQAPCVEGLYRTKIKPINWVD